MKKHASRLCLLLMLGMGVAPSIFAQVFPTKPIKFVVGYAPGGAVDAVARSVGQAMSTSMAQPVVVENKPGAGANIAVKSVISSEPDGYTLLMAANALAANMALYQPKPFDVEKDLVAVSMIGRVPVVIAANPSVPYSNIKQLIDAVKNKPNSISYGSPGNGSTPHMAVELFAQAITDVIGGQIPLIAVNAMEVLPHVKSGKLKVLGVLSPKRSPIFPDVPTISESGFPGFEASVWYGLLAPAATPKAIVQRLHDETQKALQTNEVRDRMAQVGGEVVTGSSEMFAALIRSEYVRYAKLIKDANIKPD